MSAVTDQCGYPGCSVRRDKHHGWGVPNIPPHEWEQPRPITPATPAAIAARRPAKFQKHPTALTSEESNA